MNRFTNLRGIKAGTYHEKDCRPTWEVKTETNQEKRFIGLRGTKTGTNREKDHRPTWDENWDNP